MEAHQGWRVAGVLHRREGEAGNSRRLTSWQGRDSVTRLEFLPELQHLRDPLSESEVGPPATLEARFDFGISNAIAGSTVRTLRPSRSKQLTFRRRVEIVACFS